MKKIKNRKFMKLKLKQQHPKRTIHFLQNQIFYFLCLITHLWWHFDTCYTIFMAEQRWVAFFQKTTTNMPFPYTNGLITVPIKWNTFQFLLTAFIQNIFFFATIMNLLKCESIFKNRMEIFDYLEPDTSKLFPQNSTHVTSRVWAFISCNTFTCFAINLDIFHKQNSRKMCCLLKINYLNKNKNRITWHGSLALRLIGWRNLK